MIFGVLSLFLLFSSTTSAWKIYIHLCSIVSLFFVFLIVWSLRACIQISSLLSHWASPGGVNSNLNTKILFYLFFFFEIYIGLSYCVVFFFFFPLQENCLKVGNNWQWALIIFIIWQVCRLGKTHSLTFFFCISFFFNVYC